MSTAYTVTFAVHWWLVTPHDGRRIASSPAQQRIIDEARKAGVGSGLDPQQAIYAAQAKWNDEKGFSALVLVASWVIKVRCLSSGRVVWCGVAGLTTESAQIFFLLCLYSFAMHLRRGTYRSLPTSKPGLAGTAVSSSQTASPFRRRGSAYAYSHVRNASSVSEYEMHAESGADGTKQGGSGLEDLEPTPVPSSLSQADGFASLGRPPMSVSGGGVPTVPGGAASPALMRSRSAGQ